MNKYLFILFVLVFPMINLWGQISNPFELEHRLDSEVKWSPTKKIVEEAPKVNPFEKENFEVVKLIAEDSVLAEVVSGNDSLTLQDELKDPGKEAQQTSFNGNPFDLVSGGNVYSNPIVGSEQKARINNVSPIDRNTTESKVRRFIFTCIMLMLILMAILSTFFRHFIFKVYESFISDNLLRANYRAMGTMVSFPYVLLELFFILNGALTMFLIFDKLGYGSGYFLKDFLFSLMIAGVFVLGKHILLYIVSEVFPVDKEAAIYNFTISNFYIILGLILVPINLFLAYSPANISNIFLYLTAILGLLLMIYLGFRGILIGSKYLMGNRFHFFMYLCTVEIAPLFILTKMVNNYIGG